MVGLREILGAAGAVGGAMAGWILGGLLGAVVGCFVAGIAVGVPFEAHDAWRRRRKRSALQPFFGEYLAPEKTHEWEQAVTQIKPGVVVRGRVVHASRRGVFVDIGYGFPAILPGIPRTRGEKPSADRLEAGPLPEPGSEVEAQIKGFDPLEREIEITQGGRWLLLDGEIVGFVAHAEWPVEGRYYLRYTRSDAYDAFLKLPKAELATRCEVLTGDERQRVAVKRESWSGYVYVSIRLLEGPPPPP